MLKMYSYRKKILEFVPVLSKPVKGLILKTLSVDGHLANPLKSKYNAMTEPVANNIILYKSWLQFRLRKLYQLCLL